MDSQGHCLAVGRDDSLVSVYDLRAGRLVGVSHCNSNFQVILQYDDKWSCNSNCVRKELASKDDGFYIKFVNFLLFEKKLCFASLFVSLIEVFQCCFGTGSQLPFWLLLF